MRQLKILLVLIPFFPLSLFAQVDIFREDFGNTAFFRAPANTYNDYSSDKNLFSSDSISIHNWETELSTYSGASGEGFALCGYVGNNVVNIIQVGPVNTIDYSGIRLSFGAAAWYGNPADHMDIFYSTDGSTWIQVDDSQVSEGNYYSAAWGYVTLSEDLPSVAGLYLRFHVTSLFQAVRFDDIVLSGFPTDNTPPSQPGTPVATVKDKHSMILEWAPSADDNGIDHYEVLVNGLVMATPSGNSVKLKYLNPGADYSIRVIAYDPGLNASVESNELIESLDPLPVDYKYSWQKPQALVAPGGNLEWAPEDFVFNPGTSTRYIDFEEGDDNNDGLSTSGAWKHHPWDPAATGNAAAETGIHTYVFKRGVVYRGNLVAEESGQPGNPIRLTSDPSWGTGEAAIYGSERFTGGWTLSSTSVSPKIPEPDKVWYRNISLFSPNVVVELNGEEMKRIRLARTPNYRFTPDDPLKTWHVMKYKYYSESKSRLILGDDDVLTQPEVDYYKGGRIWSQEDVIVMCTVWGQDILNYDPTTSRIEVSNKDFGGVGCHYYIENTPYLLDTTSEYYYDKLAGRLYLRLDGDKDPNTTTIEIARKSELISMNSKQNIEISGLSFGFTTNNSYRFGYSDLKPAIDIRGSCTGITIRNNKFYYLNGGIAVEGTGSTENNAGDILISDNDFFTIDDLGIVVAGVRDAYLEDVSILRNRIYDNGARQRGRWYSSIPAIWAQLVSGEVAGNIVDYSFGNGVDIFWGKGGSSPRDVPFIRGIIHHNKASNTLLGTNDYGGIESWQGGPAFCYNNISHNASGYKHFNNTSIGEAFYFDGSFKHIIFNNIASGVSTERNNTAFMQVLGYYNMYVHNTGYNISNLFSSGSGDLRSCGYNTYLSNVGHNVNSYFRHSIYSQYVPFESYDFNVSSGNEFVGSLIDKNTTFDLPEFVAELENYKTRKTGAGWNAVAPALEDPANFDFSPRSDGEAIDRGVRFFAAFPLKSVVGEWHFYKHYADSSIIAADNFYMTEDFSNRNNYHSIPKNHLKAYNLADTSFREGYLEDWIEGSLWFNGTSTYCSLSNAISSARVSNDVNISTDNFILETFLKTDADHTNGVILSKTDGTNGYEMGIDNSGKAYISLFSGGSTYTMTSAFAINDTEWHHLLAEVNRKGLVRIYVDGRDVSDASTGSIPGAGESLSNAEDLLVGKNSTGNFFSGQLDFLRISKGTLADARTTIDELYTWETDGPFLYDFNGNPAMGKRDAGAIEGGIKNCSLSVSTSSLDFNESASMQSITIDASEGFVIYNSTGDFYSTLIDGNTIEVSSEENLLFAERTGEIEIFGCNESAIVKVHQDGSPCILEPEIDTAWFEYSASKIRFKVLTNGKLTAKRNSSFFNYIVSETGDSIEISVKENTMGPERIGELTVMSCEEEIIIPVIQAGDPNSTGAILPDGLDIFPNPVDDGLLTIRFREAPRGAVLSITNLEGKEVFNTELYNEVNNIEPHLAPGIYMLNINGSKQIINYKLVIL